MTKITLFVLLAALKVNAQQSTIETGQGKTLYSQKCTLCHGKSGSKGFFGAKDLTRSALSESEYFAVISSGRRNMPKWKHKLTDEQIKSVIHYIKTLRKP